MSLQFEKVMPLVRIQQQRQGAGRMRDCRQESWVGQDDGVENIFIAYMSVFRALPRKWDQLTFLQFLTPIFRILFLKLIKQMVGTINSEKSKSRLIGCSCLNKKVREIIQQVFSYHHMYLGSQSISHPQPSLLYLTGQLTIMAHPPHLLHPHHLQHPQYVSPYAYNMSAYEQPTSRQHPLPRTSRSPLHPQYTEQPQHYPPPFQADHPCQHSQPKQPQQPPPSQARKHSGEVEEGNPRQEGLEGRVEHLEKMYSSISKVNAQTLEAFRDIRGELIHRIAAQDQVSSEKIKKLVEIGDQSERKSQELLQKQEKRLEDKQKRMKEEEKKLEITRQEIQSQFQSTVRQKMKELLEQEKVQGEKFRKEQYQKLAQETDLYRNSVEEKMQAMADKMEEIAEKREKLEDRLQLKIKEEVKRLSASVKEAEARSQGQIQSLKNQLRAKERKSSDMEEQPRESVKQGEQQATTTKALEQYVMPTPSVLCFTIHQNTITRSSGDDGSRKMVLLDAVVGEGVFSFRTHIHNTKEGRMCIGVTDRVTQKEKDWAQHQHSIKYWCYSGDIIYAADDDYQYEGGGIELQDGMELLCEVEREKCQVTFTVFKGGLNQNSRQMHNLILSHPRRQFVPFFEMSTIGDRISLELQ